MTRRLEGNPEETPESGRRSPASDKYQLPQLGDIVSGVSEIFLHKLLIS